MKHSSIHAATMVIVSLPEVIVSRLHLSVALILAMLIGTSDAWAIAPEVGKARILLEKERTSDAELILKGCLAKNPNDFDAHVELAALYNFMELPDKASKEIQRAFEIQPKSKVANAYRVRAETYRLCHEFLKALSDIDAAARLDGRDTSITHRYRARCLRVLGLKKKALEESQKAVAMSEKSKATNAVKAADLEERAQANAVMKKNLEARRDIDSAIRLMPDAGVYFRTRGWFLRNKKQFEFAVSDADSALQINPSDVRALTLKGTILLDNRRHKEAVALLRQALREAPWYWPAHMTMALYLSQSLEIKGAIAHLDKAIKLNPYFGELYRFRGDLYQDLGDLNNAIKNFSLAISHGDQASIAKKGVVYQAMGKHEEAVSEFTKAIETYPVLARPYKYRAISLEKLGKRKEAETDYAMSTKLHPNSSTSLESQGLFYMREKQYEKAVEAFSSLLKNSPKYLKARRLRATAYEKLGKLDLAKKDRACLRGFNEAIDGYGSFSDMFSDAKKILGK